MAPSCGDDGLFPDRVAEHMASHVLVLRELTRRCDHSETVRNYPGARQSPAPELTEQERDQTREAGRAAADACSGTGVEYILCTAMIKQAAQP